MIYRYFFHCYGLHDCCQRAQPVHSLCVAHKNSGEKQKFELEVSVYNIKCFLFVYGRMKNDNNIITDNNQTNNAARASTKVNFHFFVVRGWNT